MHNVRQGVAHQEEEDDDVVVAFFLICIFIFWVGPVLITSFLPVVAYLLHQSAFFQR